jgi:hypothetical protein
VRHPRDLPFHGVAVGVISDPFHQRVAFDPELCADRSERAIEGECDRDNSVAPGKCTTGCQLASMSSDAFQSNSPRGLIRNSRAATPRAYAGSRAGKGI